MTKTIKILYINSESGSINIQDGLNKEDELIIVRNVSEAFTVLANHTDISIIIFNETKGGRHAAISFLQQVRLKYPDSVRILIASSEDCSFLIDAVNCANLFKFIKKPFTSFEIRDAVKAAKVFYLNHLGLIDKYQALEKSYDRLDKYAYSVTHDLRRPLLSILGAVEAAQNIDNLVDLRKLLEMMEESVKNMDNFIHNIQEYYKLKHGIFQFEDINFYEIVKDQKKIYQMAAKMDDIRFLSSVKQKAPFKNDRMAITLILNNLLSNAVKYQRKNNSVKRIEININVSESMAIITVKDNGIGIPNGHISKIFNMFFRVNSEEIGSGVGLYTVKDALLKLNGNIEVESEVNVGTTFTVTIPGK